MYITIKAVKQMMKIIDALELDDSHSVQLYDRQGADVTFVISQSGIFKYDGEKWVLQTERLSR